MPISLIEEEINWAWPKKELERILELKNAKVARPKKTEGTEKEENKLHEDKLKQNFSSCVQMRCA